MRAKPWDVSDELWERIGPLLPGRERRFRYPGRKRFDDRLALQGILFVLHTGIGWEHLPCPASRDLAGSYAARDSLLMHLRARAREAEVEQVVRSEISHVCPVRGAIYGLRSRWRR